MTRRVVFAILLCGGAVRAAAQPAPAPRFRPIAPGQVRPMFIAGVPDGGLAVAGFLLAERPVSNAEYLRFVTANPEWQRSRVARIAADVSYLRHWAGDTRLGPEVVPAAPVVNVSWFAARAYADWVGGRLPTTQEWELAASRFRTSISGDPDRVNAQLLALSQAGARDTTPLAAFRIVSDEGVTGLFGGPSEWVDDFNTVVTSGESRGDSGPDDGLFCAGGAALAADPSNYSAFMRYALRGSLRGSYALATLGVRVARDAPATRSRGPR